MNRILPLAAVWSAMMAGQAHAQTTIDLRTQSKSLDFTGLQYTKPVRMGGSLPATCQVGELYLLSGAVIKLYNCAAVNSWLQVQMSGGGTMNPNDCAKFDVNGNLVSAGAPCGAGGSGGGSPVLTPVSFSATPAFPISNSTQGFTLTLSGSVTSSAFSGTPVDGQEVWFRICQDSAGAHSFAYPTAVSGADVIDTAASACTSQLFKYLAASGSYAAITSAISDSSSTPGLVTPTGVLALPPAPDTLLGASAFPITANHGGTGQSSYTKGDILCAANSNTLNKLGVGSDASVLTADSTQACGVKWAAGGGGGGGSISITTAGQGWCTLFTGCTGYPVTARSSYTGIGDTHCVGTNGTGSYCVAQVMIPFTVKLTQMYFPFALSGSGKGAIFQLLDSGGNPVANTFVRKPDTSGGFGAVSFSTPATISPGIYNVEWAVEDAGTNVVFLDNGINQPRSLPMIWLSDVGSTTGWYSCSNSPTGTGATLNFPATCGTKTAVQSNPPLFVAVP